MTATTICRGCGAPIIWAVTPNGKRIPINPEPHPTGNIELDTTHRPTRATVHSQGPLGVDTLYLAHFATCPNADRFRKRQTNRNP